MKNLIFILLFVISAGTGAAQVGDWFVLPRASVGYNVAQGTYFLLGAEAGTYFTEQIVGGVGAHYAAGEHASHDREIAGGPFVGFFQPLTSFLLLSAREEIDYMDVYIPVKKVGGASTEYSHLSKTGVASATSIGLHVFLSRSFVVSGGYRLMVGLTNSDIAKDRSGTFMGISIGI